MEKKSKEYGWVSPSKSINQLASQQQQIVIIPSEASIRTIQSATQQKPDNSKKVVQWRKYSRRVSYADMVITLASFSQGAVLVVMAVLGVMRVYQHNEWDELKTFATVVLVLCSIKLLKDIIGFWISYKLYSATNPLTLQPTAIEKAKRWRGFHIFGVILELVVGLVTNYKVISIGLFSFLWFLLRIGFILVVHKFIKEMEKSEGTAADDESTRKSAASVRPVMIIAEPVVVTAPSSARSKA